MTGFPISRVMSSDGRWAYTLYGRPSGEPFVHALDTVRARAVCIDLPSVSSATVGGAHLKLGDGAATLEILSGGLAVARIDTHTFAVSSQTGSAATAASVTPAANRRSAESGGGWPWELLLLPIAALALGAAAVWRRARPRAI
jgi:hypothetical protein